MTKKWEFNSHWTLFLNMCFAQRYKTFDMVVCLKSGAQNIQTIDIKTQCKQAWWKLEVENKKGASSEE